MVRVAQSFVFCVVLSLFVLFIVCHFVFCPSSSYGFWLPTLSILWFTASDYLLCLSYDLRLLITHFVYPMIYGFWLPTLSILWITASDYLLWYLQSFLEDNSEIENVKKKILIFRVQKWNNKIIVSYKIQFLALKVQWLVPYWKEIKQSRIRIHFKVIRV